MAKAGRVEHSTEMIPVKESDRQSVLSLYGNPKRLSASVFGIGKAVQHDDVSQGLSSAAREINGIVSLQEHELLKKDPAAYSIVQFIKDGRTELLDEVIEERAASIPVKDKLIATFNAIISSCGIGSNSESYGIFKRIVAESGAGVSIELDERAGLVQPVLKLSNEVVLSFDLSQRLPWRQADNVAVLCFNGHVDKVRRLHKVFTWAGESSQPILVAATSFSQEVIQTVEHNNAVGKLKVLLCKADLQKEAQVFSIADLGGISSSVDYQELPEEFSPNGLGNLSAVMVSPLGAIKCAASADSIRAHRDRVQEELSSLSDTMAAQHVRARLNKLNSAKLQVVLPKVSKGSSSSLMDELSCMLSLWSSMLSEAHILASNGLHSMPVDSFMRAAEFVRSTMDNVSNIGLVLKR